jgi:anti-sigma B factor antagonist
MPAVVHTVGGGSAGGDNVALHGRITIENSGEMRRMLSNALRAKPATVSVDLSNVAYIDTSGLATLLEAVRIARRQGTRLILAGVHDQPRYLLEITHLDQFFEMAAPEAGK